MIFYHGTTLDAARSIEREGLKRMPENAFRLQWPDGTPIANHPYIYLQPILENAELYAGFRAQYERANYGDIIRYNGQPLRKSTSVKHLDALPAIVTLDIPQTYVKRLKPDEDGITGYVCACDIPPKYIKEVQSVCEL